MTRSLQDAFENASLDAAISSCRGFPERRDELMLVQIRVFKDEDGAWCASGVDHGIHTQGETLDELYANIEEATQLHFEDELAAGKTIDVLIVAEREFVGAPAAGR